MSAGPTDAEGAKRGQASAALEELYRVHAGDTYRLAYLLTGNREMADDLAQEAFARVISRFRHLRDRANFEPYLRRTVVNLASNQFRGRSIQRRYMARYGDEKRAVAEIPDIETRHDLWQLLQQLPPRQRSALVLRYYEDLSEHQAADVLGVSVRARNSLVTRGLEQLRRRGGGPEWTD